MLLNISEDYINSEKEGQIKTAWFSMDNTDKTEIKYTFKVNRSGTAEFKTKINGGFATGKLKVPDKYNEGKLTLEVEKQPLIIRILKIIFISIVVLIVIKIFFVLTTKNNKKIIKNKKIKMK